MMKFLEAAKAYVALIGAVTSALLGVFTADTPVGQVLTVIAVVATAIVTYTVPNAAPASPTPGGYAESSQAYYTQDRRGDVGATNVLYALGALLVAVAVILLITTVLKIFVVSIPLLIVIAVIGVALVIFGGRTGGRAVV